MNKKVLCSKEILISCMLIGLAWTMKNRIELAKYIMVLLVEFISKTALLCFLVFIIWFLFEISNKKDYR